MSVEEVLRNLNKAVFDYDTDAAASWARKVIAEKIDPIQAANSLTEAITEVGDCFNREELWLPELIGAADAMKSAMSILEEEISRQGLEIKSLGTVVVGTVYGDIHDIGKSMVSTLLTAGGFAVHDIGIDIPTDEFVEATIKYKPDILAMSSLLTTTAPEQGKVIEILKEYGLRDKVKIIVGGGAITEEFANAIGADGYEATAPAAVALVKRLLGKG